MGREMLNEWLLILIPIAVIAGVWSWVCNLDAKAGRFHALIDSKYPEWEEDGVFSRHDLAGVAYMKIGKHIGFRELVVAEYTPAVLNEMADFIDEKYKR